MDTTDLHGTPKYRQPTSTSHSIWKHETFTALQNNIVTAVIVEHATNLDIYVVKHKYGLGPILRYNMVRVKMQIGVNRNCVACLLLPPPFFLSFSSPSSPSYFMRTPSLKI